MNWGVFFKQTKATVSSQDSAASETAWSAGSVRQLYQRVPFRSGKVVRQGRKGLLKGTQRHGLQPRTFLSFTYCLPRWNVYPQRYRFPARGEITRVRCVHQQSNLFISTETTPQSTHTVRVPLEHPQTTGGDRWQEQTLVGLHCNTVTDNLLPHHREGLSSKL